MAIEGSMLSEQANAIGGLLAADPVITASVAAVTALGVMIVVRLRRRKASEVEAPPIAATRRKARQPRPNDLIEDRFAALRLQTEELEALAPPPRHFRGTEQRAASHYLRRR